MVNEGIGEHEKSDDRYGMGSRGCQSIIIQEEQRKEKVVNEFA